MLSPDGRYLPHVVPGSHWWNQGVRAEADPGIKGKGVRGLGLGKQLQGVFAMFQAFSSSSGQGPQALDSQCALS